MHDQEAFPIARPLILTSFSNFNLGDGCPKESGKVFILKIDENGHRSESIGKTIYRGY